MSVNLCAVVHVFDGNHPDRLMHTKYYLWTGAHCFPFSSEDTCITPESSFNYVMVEILHQTSSFEFLKGNGGGKMDGRRKCISRLCFRYPLYTHKSFTFSHSADTLIQSDLQMRNISSNLS